MPVPNPSGAKYFLVYDKNGGESYQLPVTINPNGVVDPGSNILYAGSGSLLTDEVLLQSNAGVNLNTATEQPLYTVPVGRSCIITFIVVRNASTSLTLASYSAGFNTGTDTNVIANATHTELTGSTLYTKINPINGAAVGTAGQILNLKNNTLQGGAATVTIDVFGYLF